MFIEIMAFFKGLMYERVRKFKDKELVRSEARHRVLQASFIQAQFLYLIQTKVMSYKNCDIRLPLKSWFDSSSIIVDIFFSKYVKFIE